jgi:hypothetical protein
MYLRVIFTVACFLYFFSHIFHMLLAVVNLNLSWFLDFVGEQYLYLIVYFTCFTVAPARHKICFVHGENLRVVGSKMCQCF